MAELGEHGCLVITQMAQTIGRQLISAHCFYQSGYFPCSSRHQCTFQGRYPESIQHTCRNTDDILRCRTNFISNQILSVINTDQITVEGIHKFFLYIFIIAVYYHTVWHSIVEFLYMSRSNPYCNFIGKIHTVIDNLCQPSSCRNLDSLHAKHKNLILQIVWL